MPDYVVGRSTSRRWKKKFDPRCRFLIPTPPCILQRIVSENILFKFYSHPFKLRVRAILLLIWNNLLRFCQWTEFLSMQVAWTDSDCNLNFPSNIYGIADHWTVTGRSNHHASLAWHLLRFFSLQIFPNTEINKINRRQIRWKLFPI